MKSRTMDQTDDRCRLDAMSQGVIGRPLPRPDGPLKVSGLAKYAAEFEAANCLEGVLVTAPVTNGRIRQVHVNEALDLDGVVSVLTGETLTTRSAQGTAGEAPAQNLPQIDYWGQPIALVVAETFEQARHAAKHLEVEFEETEAVPVSPDDRDVEWTPKEAKTTRQGDLAHAMAQAAHSVDIEFTTEGHASAAMEPHAAMAQWNGEEEKLTLHASLQMLNYNVPELADALGLEEEQVRILSPFVGGGFGSKLGISPECIAASHAAMQLGRPVRVVMSRQQVFQCVMRRSETRQRLRLAADAEGRLTGFGHEGWVTNLPGESFAEPVLQASEFLYAGDNRELVLNVGRIHRVTAGSVRAPGEAVGMQALEAAMDELAEAVGIDPVELRLRNIPDKHPSQGIPFSSRKLAECLREGAERFGWDGADRKPCQRREGEWWIGTGMASAARVHNFSKASARVTLREDGTGLVETDMTDIGTGTYAILGQVAGEMLGLDPGDVLVELGDSALPKGPGSGGSWGAASSGSAVYLACEAIREELCDRLGCEEADLTLKDGFAIVANKRTALVDVLDGTPLQRTGKVEPGETEDKFAQAMFGAFFTEVAVNAYTGETRVRRMVGTFGIGRVLNEMTARSQCQGGMAWAIGSALTEELAFDDRDGHLVNPDLAEYHVPVNLDVPTLEVHFVEERDPAASPIQAKGVGELGICGGAGAIANAIYNACGVRLRSFPMTPDKVMAGLPDP